MHPYPMGSLAVYPHFIPIPARAEEAAACTSPSLQRIEELAFGGSRHLHRLAEGVARRRIRPCYQPPIRRKELHVQTNRLPGIAVGRAIDAGRQEVHAGSEIIAKLPPQPPVGTHIGKLRAPHRQDRHPGSTFAGGRCRLRLTRPGRRRSRAGLYSRSRCRFFHNWRRRLGRRRSASSPIGDPIAPVRRGQSHAGQSPTRRSLLGKQQHRLFAGFEAIQGQPPLVRPVIYQQESEIVKIIQAVVQPGKQHTLPPRPTWQRAASRLCRKAGLPASGSRAQPNAPWTEAPTHGHRHCPRHFPNA